MAQTKQLKIQNAEVYMQFSDAPTRTQLRELFNYYMSTNKKIEGSDLAIGLADAFEQASWTKVPWTGYTVADARKDAEEQPRRYKIVSDDGSESQ